MENDQDDHKPDKNSSRHSKGHKEKRLDSDKKRIRKNNKSDLSNNKKSKNNKKNVKTNGNKKGNGKDNGSNIKWVIIIWISSFFLSGIFSILSSGIMSRVDTFVAVIVLVMIILINIIFDIIGTASTAADPVPFHSMAARKVKGAKEAIMLIKHAEKVSNFCNDVVGDICGILSGAAATYIVLKIVERGLFAGSAINQFIEIILSGLVASLTVGGKSIGKTLAIKKSNDIIYRVAMLIRIFKRKRR